MEPLKHKDIDIREYLRLLRKRKWIILIIFSIVLLFTAVQTFTETPVFRATAQIVIEKENPNLVSIQEVMSMDSTGSDYYQTQYKILESRTVAREVIKRLDLANSPEFNPKPRKDIISIIKNAFAGTGGKIKKSVASTLNREEGAPGKGEASKRSAKDSGLVSALIGRISVQPVRKSRLVNVSLTATDPVLAAQIANEVAQTYIDLNLETKLLAAKDAVQWLTKRIDEERKKVEVAENALLNYKEKFEIITDFSSDSENITAEKLAKLNAQVVDAQSQRVEAETRYRQALELEKTPEMLDSIPEVLGNELIQQIKKMEVNLYNRMSELSKKYGAKHPRMIAIQSELEDLSKRKIKEASRIVNSLKNEWKLAVARERSLKKALSLQKNESLAMNKKAIEFGVLQREAESSRHMYELLIKRFKETSLTEEMKTGNIRIIDRAEIPGSPVSPNKKKSLMVAALLGIFLGLGVAFLLEYFDNTVKLPDEIKDYFDIPYLGPVPAFDTNETMDNNLLADIITAHSPKSTASESFRGIRTGIQFSSPDSAPRVILVTSAEPAEGKTLCAANLAVTMAQSGGKVLLIDCDMRRPKVHSLFKMNRDVGISSIMVGAATPNEAIRYSEIENLYVMPCGPIPPNPSEILGSKKMRALLSELKKEFATIVIDSPPITAVTDSVVVAQAVDGVVLVIRAGDTSRQAVHNGVTQLKGVNVNILGGVLNAVNAKRDNYYYQYYYYYYGDKKDGKDRKKKANRKRKSH